MNGQFGPGSTVLVVGEPCEIPGGLAAELEQAGFVALSVPNGETALRVIELHGEVVDAVVTSILLPGWLSGWRVGAAFQKKSPGRAVVYASEGMFDQPASRPLVGFVSRTAHARVAIATLISTTAH